MPRPFPISEGARGRWLVTGAAGFIGSHLIEALLNSGMEVRGLDNFSTGSRANLENVAARVGKDAWKRFEFIEGDIRDRAIVAEVCRDAKIVLHQAALGSVPRSVEDPATSNAVNVDGTLNVFLAARDAGVKRLVYASSSAVYGDEPNLPKIESRCGKVLSPYGLTKAVNEEYARLFTNLYGAVFVGLRYFNVIGPRQNPNGPYAAVLPRWLASLVNGASCTIFGDGSTSRDFCDVRNVVAANILAATAGSAQAVKGSVFNIACGERTTLLELYGFIAEELRECGKAVPERPEFAPERIGDVKHSLADVSHAQKVLGYCAQFKVRDAVRETVRAFVGEEK